eukprot:656818-Rhodomonas_salina.4
MSATDIEEEIRLCRSGKATLHPSAAEGTPALKPPHLWSDRGKGTRETGHDGWIEEGAREKERGGKE